MNMITLEQLKALEPCQEQWDIVVKEFPDGIPITEQSMTKALGLKLDIDWLAENILPENLLAEYNRQVDPLRAEYKRQEAFVFLGLLLSI